MTFDITSTLFLQTKGHVPQAQLSPTSDEYVLDLLSTCEEKLLKLMEDLDGHDVDDTLQQMEEEEVSLALFCEEMKK